MRPVLRALPTLHPLGVTRAALTRAALTRSALTRSTLAVPVVAVGVAASLALGAVPALGSSSASSSSAALSAAALAAAPAATAPTPPTPKALLTQRLSWSECLPGKGFTQLQCAIMVAPADWKHPTGTKIKVAVSRVLSGDRASRRGVLFTNPGGPGAGGLAMPLFINVSEPDVSAAYDVYGMDVRGSGSSTRLSCVPTALRSKFYGLDGQDASAANQKAIVSLSKQFATTCVKTSFTKDVTTFQTVRDLDLLRAVLREKKVSYVGYSAGTWLGAWYATTFPTHVDRLLLDGNVDFTGAWYASFDRQPAGFQTSFDRYFLPWVAHYSGLYGQGTTTAAVKQNYLALRASLAKDPVTLPDGTVLNAVGLDNAIIGGLYWIGNYPDVAGAISVLGHLSNTTPEDQALLVKVFGGTALISGDTFWAITCQDTANPAPARVNADAAKYRKTAPLVGASNNADPCAYWPGKPIGSPVTGKKLPPILMINNGADPATPLANARLARKHTPSAVLVTVSGEPDHTIYGSGDACVERIANAWLIDGVRPKADAVCPGLPLPDPTVPVTPPGTPVPSPAPAAPAAGASSGSVGSAAELSVPVYRAPSTATADEKPHGDTGGTTPAQVWLDKFVGYYGSPNLG